MAMEKINGSPLVRQAGLDQAKHQERVDDARAQESGPRSAAPAPERKGGDTAEISATAQRLMELRRTVDVGRTALAALPDIREDKVAQARERLANGHYQSDEVREQAAENLSKVIRSMETP